MKKEKHIVRTWMLLVYNVPNKPTSSRLYVWRKLKKLGLTRGAHAANAAATHEHS